MRRPWYDARCHRARAQLRRVTRQHGHQAECTREHRGKYRGVLRTARTKYVAELEKLRLSQPADFWKLLKKPVSSIKVAAAALYEHYVKLLAQLPTGYAAE